MTKGVLAAGAIVTAAAALLASCALMPPAAKTLDYVAAVDTGTSPAESYDLAIQWLSAHVQSRDKNRYQGDPSAHSISVKMGVRMKTEPSEVTDIRYTLRIDLLPDRTQFLFHIDGEWQTSYNYHTLAAPTEPFPVEIRLTVSQNDYDAFSGRMRDIVASYRDFLAHAGS